ncbi:hypothetical protein J5J10_01475 [Ciceribacter sp. L1K23]|uniref:hypothetical protein n=1 Tax=Ciceribacter sp. L1K23 TaxID=2820276 RepID=UPI001B83C2ED|nr:hypothetical protein [Ciceribacter sp. L1K23]MBR0554337.1 hypothetical protein [Ciceribacter sp. L1K23]
MVRKSKKQRNAEQRIRQQKNRDMARECRRPTRDDIARTLLWQMIVTAEGRANREAFLAKLRDEVVAQLVRQGFDRKESKTVFEAIASKYRADQPPFRIKRHLHNTVPADTVDQ